jgi:hypothetical protein
MNIFLLLIFAVSAAMVGYTYNCHSQISYKCVSKNVNIGMNLLLMLNVMLLILPITHLLCYVLCEKCHSISGNIHVMILIISLFMIITGSVIWNGLDNENNCYNTDAKSYIVGVVITSVVILVLDFIVFFYRRKKNTKHDLINIDQM